MKKLLDVSFISESPDYVVYGVTVETSYFWSNKKKTRKIIAMVERNRDYFYTSFGAKDIQTGKRIGGFFSDFSEHVANTIAHVYRTTHKYDNDKYKLKL